MINFNDENLRVLNITHWDLDGVVSSIILKNFYKDVMVESVTHSRNDYIGRVKEKLDEFDVIIFTDFTPESFKPFEEMGKPFMVLDHHESALKFKNLEKNIIIDTRNSASKLVYRWYNSLGKKDISHLEELVELTNDYDMWIMEDKRCLLFNNLFWLFGFEWFSWRFLNGNLKFYDEEIEYLEHHKKSFKDYYDNLSIVELPMNGVMYKSYKYSSEINILLGQEYDYIIILGDSNYSLSIRSMTDEIDLVKVTEMFGRGGGHKYSAGVPYKNESANEVVKGILKVIKHLKEEG